MACGVVDLGQDESERRRPDRRGHDPVDGRVTTARYGGPV